MKNKEEKRVLGIIFLTLTILTIFFVFFFPMYDSLNGFFLYGANFSINFKSTENMLVFSLVKRCLNQKPLYFYPNETIFRREVKTFPDMYKINGTYYTSIPKLSIKTYCFFSSFFKPKSDRTILLSILFLNTVFLLIEEFVFFFSLKNMGISTIRSAIYTFLFLVSTGFIIFVRYLFIPSWLLTFFVTLSLFFLFFSKKRNYFLSILLLFFSGIFSTVFSFEWIILPFIAIFSVELSKPNFKRLFFLIVFASISLLLTSSWFFRISISRLSSSQQTFYTPLELKTYGFYKLSNGTPIPRGYPSFPYSFNFYPQNALFLPGFYSFFFHLFSERGIILNSPYLIFSILGILTFLSKKELITKQIIFFILLYLITFSLYPNWFGGGSPRYDRFSLPISFLLSLFSFYYLDNLLKRKKYFLVFIFSILLSLSILNVLSISTRKDWLYSTDYELFSYDLVLWPWVKPLNLFNLILSSPSEQHFWRTSSFDNCKAILYWEGIKTDNCFCNGTSIAERYITLPFDWKKAKISFKACTGKAGDDFVVAIFKIKATNESTHYYLIPSNSCISESIEVLLPKNHTIKIVLGTKIFESCDEEWVIWKNIKLEKES